MRMLLAVAVMVVSASGFGCAAGDCRSCDNCRDCGDGKHVVTRYDEARGRYDNAVRGDSAGIRVESARYGRDEQWVDVTPQVRGLINGDTIVFPRDLHKTFNVDPVPGRMKYVEMFVIIDGRVMEMTLGDSLHVTPLRLRAAGGGGGERASTGATNPTDDDAADDGTQ